MCPNLPLGAMKGLLAVLIVGLLGGGIAVVAIDKLSPEEKIVHTQPAPPPTIETNIVPPAGQSLVTGTLRSFTSDDAAAQPIHTPFTINAVERGARNGATIEG